MYSAQGANSYIYSQSNSPSESDSSTIKKKNKKPKITAGQSSYDKHYLNKLAKQCSP